MRHSTKVTKAPAAVQIKRHKLPAKAQGDRQAGRWLHGLTVHTRPGVALLTPPLLLHLRLHLLLLLLLLLLLMVQQVGRCGGRSPEQLRGNGSSSRRQRLPRQ